MVKHKSRLEREKEVAEQQRKAEEAAQAQRAKRKVVHTPGSWAKQVGHTQLLHYQLLVTLSEQTDAGVNPRCSSLDIHVICRFNLERHCRSSKSMQGSNCMPLKLVSMLRLVYVIAHTVCMFARAIVAFVLTLFGATGVDRVWANWASTKAGWRRRKRLLQRLAGLQEPALLWVASCPATCAPRLLPRLCRRCAVTSRLLSLCCAAC